MSIIPLDLERRFEQRWAARFVAPVASSAPHVGGTATREIHHAKADHDGSVADPDRHFGGDCADGWFAKSIRVTSIDKPATDPGGTGRPPPTAVRPSALGEKPDR